MKKNLFLSISSLILTTFLLFFLVFGWYVSNDQVSVNGIFGESAGSSYTASLDRAIVDNDGNIKDWVDTRDLRLKNIAPGNKFFFRLELNDKSDKPIDLNVQFSDLKSELNNEKLKVIENKVCIAPENVWLYELINNEVRINEKLLYSYDGVSLKLGDYLIEDTFLLYNFSDIEPKTTTIPTDITGVGIKNLESFNIKSNGYFYFALEFNEELSLNEVNGVKSSNCYLYQSLLIPHIILKQI